MTFVILCAFFAWNSTLLTFKSQTKFTGSYKKIVAFSIFKKRKNEEKLLSVINLKKYFYKGMEHAEVEKYIEVCFEILSGNKLRKRYPYSELFWPECGKIGPE